MSLAVYPGRVALCRLAAPSGVLLSPSNNACFPPWQPEPPGHLPCRVLADLEALIRSQDMPGDHAAAYEFVLRRANILYACGKNVSQPVEPASGRPSRCMRPLLQSLPACQPACLCCGTACLAAWRASMCAWALRIPRPSPSPQEAYLDVTMPVLSSTLRALEAEHRQVSSRKGGVGGGGEGGPCLAAPVKPVCQALHDQRVAPVVPLHPRLQLAGEPDQKLAKRLRFLSRRAAARGGEAEGEGGGS